MAKCQRCQKRKARRRCPALGSDLCSLCCGLLRDKEIHCPPGCIFLAQHKPYTEKKILGKKQSLASKNLGSGEDIFNDERMRWLAFQIEATLRDAVVQNPALTDGDVLLALESVKEKIGTGRGRLILPSEDKKARDPLAEAIWQSIENCRYQRTILLAAELETYSREKQFAVLERVILSIKHTAGGNFSEKRYLERLLERFAQLQELSAKKKILTPP
jgi:hypothetical protein